MEDAHADLFPNLPQTHDAVVARLARFTDEQHALAWSPQPPHIPTGPHDCRPGGDGGLDFSRETPRARWIQARHRWRRHCYDHLPLRTL